jgi:23S rRNA (adenine2503-C2)-methyltransferase
MSSPPAPPARPNLYGLDRQALETALAPLDPSPFRARQVLRALYTRDALDPAGWTEFPADLRAAVAAAFDVRRPQVAGRALAADGTLKVTMDLPGGGRVESVAIREPGRTTFCISSQVGCAYGCAFCMTARLGFGRHLDAGEIVGQVAALAAETGVARGAYNVVFMGMGEPLHNFGSVVAAVRLLTADEGLALGPRRITISTVGLAHRIVELAERDVPARLAVSLVTADQALREELMPVARRHPLPELAAAVRRFGEGKRDRPTLEVVLLAGVNDAPQHARQLAAYAHEARAKVNLIEFNPTPELPYHPPPESTIQMFLSVLSRARVVGTVRRSRGKDAYAACGQLAFLERAGPDGGAA